MSSKHLLPFFALALATSIWGINNSVMKITLLTVPVFSLAFIRFGSASLLLFPFALKHLKIKPDDIIRFVLCALFGVTLNIAFFFFGIRLTTALNAGIIIASMPLFTLFCARIFLKESLSLKLITGGFLGFSGITVIIGKDVLSNGFSLSPIGDLLMLLAALTIVVYEILGKKLSRDYSAMTITFYSFAIGALTFLPLAILETFVINPNWISAVTSQAIIGILYGIFLSSLIAYTVWQWALSKINVNRVGFFFYLDPVVSTIAAVLLLSEKITLPFIIGAALVFTGLILAEAHLPHKVK